MNRKLEILLPTRLRQNHSPRSIVGSAQDPDIEEGEDDFSKVEDEMISLFRSELLSLFIPKERIELPFLSFKQLKYRVPQKKITFKMGKLFLKRNIFLGHPV